MKSTTDKIRELSTKAAAEKASEESKRIQANIDKDMEVLENILAAVKDRLVYKEVNLPDYSRRKKYIVVTEDIVLHDYSTESVGYSTETSIKLVPDGYYTYDHIEIRVNGHLYYHAADLIAKYKYEANRALEKAQKERDAAEDRVEALRSLEDLEPTLKELMLNYNKHLGYLKAEETS